MRFVCRRWLSFPESFFTGRQLLKALSKIAETTRAPLIRSLVKDYDGRQWRRMGWSDWTQGDKIEILVGVGESALPEICEEETYHGSSLCVMNDPSETWARNPMQVILATIRARDLLQDALKEGANG